MVGVLTHSMLMWYCIIEAHQDIVTYLMLLRFIRWSWQKYQKLCSPINVLSLCLCLSYTHTHTHTQVPYYCKILKTTSLYKDMLSELNVACHKYSETLFEYMSGKTQQIQLKW